MLARLDAHEAWNFGRRHTCSNAEGKPISGGHVPERKFEVSGQTSVIRHADRIGFFDWGGG